ncbi:frizzled-4 [Aplysia californica]|uniref:Frizzled-4 n=1 Tax=Aplysia californica TaxID=6500 RepID=A0ABM0K1A2_APLCA|nr:frizzled-4 [Aplysia californica]
MDHSCSKNTRLLACSMYLPKCTRRGPPIGPCKRTCMTARRKCARPLNRMLGLTWGDKFSCRTLPNRRCLKPVRDRRCRYQHPNCVSNSPLNVCANLTFTWGTLPNMYHQCHLDVRTSNIIF